jgi:hypothetical protein
MIMGVYAELLADPAIQAVGEGKLAKRRKDKAPAQQLGLLGREARAQDTGAPRGMGPLRLTPVAATGVRSGHAAMPPVAAHGR